jgi:hypothetical protein
MPATHFYDCLRNYKDTISSPVSIEAAHPTSGAKKNAKAGLNPILKPLKRETFICICQSKGRGWGVFKIKGSISP